MPEGVANIANEEKILDYFTLTAEPGVIGGIPAGGLNFGAATNTEAVIDQPSQFDFYDGGGLDMAFLGLAQADKKGNLNVSKFGPKLSGAGGFINISQNAKKSHICRHLYRWRVGDHRLSDGKIRIATEGRARKFVKGEVEHVTFSGEYSAKQAAESHLYHRTMRLDLTSEGMVLVEIAPGLDLHKGYS